MRQGIALPANQMPPMAYLEWMTALRRREAICAARSSRRTSFALAGAPAKVRLYNMLGIAGQTLSPSRLFRKPLVSGLASDKRVDRAWGS
jgi:hypothetical protein